MTCDSFIKAAIIDCVVTLLSTSLIVMYTVEARSSKSPPFPRYLGVFWEPGTICEICLPLSLPLTCFLRLQTVFYKPPQALILSRRCRDTLNSYGTTVTWNKFVQTCFFVKISNACTFSASCSVSRCDVTSKPFLCPESESSESRVVFSRPY